MNFSHFVWLVYTLILESHEVFRSWHQSKDKTTLKGLKIEKIELSNVFLQQQLRKSHLYLLKTEKEDLPLLFLH